MGVRTHDRRRALMYVLFGTGLAATLHVLLPTAPAVYDGLPVPADPYRYVDPPPGVHNPGPPLSAHADIELIGGGNSPIDLPTGEFPPQADLELFHGDVEGIVSGVPAVTTATVTVTPVAAPATPPPPGRQFHGNVYALKVATSGHSLQLTADPQTLISLRQPRTSAADPRIAVLSDGHWDLLETHATNGRGVLSARLPRLGDVAILEQTSGFVPSHEHTGLYLGIGLGVLAVLAVAIVRFLRVRRRSALSG